MKQILAESLLNKGVIKPQMEVYASYSSVDMAGIVRNNSTGTFMIKKIYKTLDSNLIFELSSVIDGRNISVPVDNITKIDGMVPERLAVVHGIKADGTVSVQGKKRGRKPKNRIVENTEIRAVKRKGPRIKIKK